MSDVVKQVRVMLTDDIDGIEGAQTVTFALDGENWEIDLGKENRDRLTRELAPFIAAARRVAESASAGPGATPVGRVPAPGPDRDSRSREGLLRPEPSPGRIPPRDLRRFATQD